MKTLKTRTTLFTATSLVAVALLGAALPVQAHEDFRNSRHFARGHYYTVAPRPVVRYQYRPAPVGVYQPAPPVYYGPPAYVQPAYVQPAYVQPAWGAIGGAVVGAAVGSQIGHGHGRAAAIAAGTVIGAMVGDSLATGR